MLIVQLSDGVILCKIASMDCIRYFVYINDGTLHISHSHFAYNAKKNNKFDFISDNLPSVSIFLNMHF